MVVIRCKQFEKHLDFPAQLPLLTRTSLTCRINKQGSNRALGAFDQEDTALRTPIFRGSFLDKNNLLFPK